MVFLLHHPMEGGLGLILHLLDTSSINREVRHRWKETIGNVVRLPDLVECRQGIEGVPVRIGGNVIELCMEMIEGLTGIGS
jgi:hypothetical protein